MKETVFNLWEKELPMLLVSLLLYNSFLLTNRINEQDTIIQKHSAIIIGMYENLKKQKARSAKMDSLHYQWCGWELKDGLKVIPVEP